MARPYTIAERDRHFADPNWWPDSPHLVPVEEQEAGMRAAVDGETQHTLPSVPDSGPSSPGVFYGTGLELTAGLVGAASIAGIPFAITLAWLVSRLGKAIGGLVWRALLRVAPRGGKVGWSSLPGWVQGILLFLGFQKGVELAVDVAQLVTPLPGGFGTDLPALPGGLPFGAQVVSSWEANGVVFYRLSDGRLATQNKFGVWKMWRPHRPIVLHRTGAGSRNLNTLLAADAILQKQAKRIAKMLRSRGYAVGRRAMSAPGVHILETGPGGVSVKR